MLLTLNMKLSTLKFTEIELTIKFKSRKKLPLYLCTFTADTRINEIRHYTLWLTQYTIDLTLGLFASSWPHIANDEVKTLVWHLPKSY